MKKNSIFLFLTLFLILIPAKVSAAEISVIPTIKANNIIKDTVKITPYSDNISWRYKRINNILYKRKYNYTKKIWIGNWVRA